MDEEGLKKFKEKHSKTSDTIELTSKAPKMSYEEAKNIATISLMPTLNFFGMSPMANPITNPKLKKAMEALEYYRNNGVA